MSLGNGTWKDLELSCKACEAPAGNPWTVNWSGPRSVAQGYGIVGTWINKFILRSL